MTSGKPNFLWPSNIDYPATREFWHGLRRRQLLARNCLLCGERFFPPRSHCPRCLAGELDWVELSGKGTLHSWTEVSSPGPEFDSPFLLGLVDLAEGIGRLTARIVGAEARHLEIGMPVRITYEDAADNFTLYCITPDR